MSRLGVAVRLALGLFCGELIAILLKGEDAEITSWCYSVHVSNVHSFGIEPVPRATAAGSPHFRAVRSWPTSQLNPRSQRRGLARFANRPAE